MTEPTPEQVLAEYKRLRTNGPVYEGNVTYGQFVRLYDALSQQTARAEAAISELRAAACNCAPRHPSDDVPLDNLPGHHDFSCEFRRMMQPVLAASAPPALSVGNGPACNPWEGATSEEIAEGTQPPGDSGSHPVEEEGT
jgi:hypothetical protein